jgi:hypothetical protein
MRTISLCFLLLTLTGRALAQTPNLEPYNVDWTTPGPTSAASMPLGNGDIGLNIWVEPGGDVCFYISKTDAWGAQTEPGWDQWMKEGGVLMKLGMIRLTTGLTPGPGFHQTLRLSKGDILIRDGQDTLRIWVDANHPVIRVESSRPLHASLEDWRIGRGDTVLSDGRWYHENPATADPHLAGRTFGGQMKVAPHRVTIYALTAPSRAAWLRTLPMIIRTAGQDRTAARDRAAHEQWWKHFWNRSWVIVRNDFAVTRGYVLQRFVTACGGRGAYPIKFNGSIFTVDNKGQDADFRAWGGQYWFQNTRPMYWPLLASGDVDMMRPLFGMYMHMLPSNTAQVEAYYHHGGAYFQETAPFWGGLPYVGPEVEESWTRHYFTPILELSMMMLDYYAYTGNKAFLRDTLLPVARAGLTFFDRHFKRDSAGRLLLDPDNAIEMFWKVHDPAPDIAGLHAVIQRLLNITDDPWLKRLYAELPGLPANQSVLLPYTGPQTARGRNLENPELYAVFPFRLYGLGKPGLDLARNTFYARKFKEPGCWVQDPMQAALLGLADVARRYVSFNLTRKDPDLAFPAFWATGHDYKPDEDNGGNGQNGLQLMLLQAEGKTIYVLPAWPSDWDADFKLHAPGNTTVEGVVEGGKLKRLVVTPVSRRADVVVKNTYF